MQLSKIKILNFISVNCPISIQIQQNQIICIFNLVIRLIFFVNKLFK